MTEDHHLPQDEYGQTSNSGIASSMPTVDEYREYLDDFEISETQKEELLRTVWWIAMTFVDIGWKVDSVQLCLPELGEISLGEDDDALELTDPKNDFNQNAKAGESTPEP